MPELFKWLSSGHVSANIVIMVFVLLLISILLIYVISFFQGRDIYFWPPKIGKKPIKSVSDSLNVNGTVNSQNDLLSENASNNIHDSSELTILDANYGLRGRSNPVTEILKSKIKNDKLEILVKNENLGGDPYRGETYKILSVAYRYKGKVFVRSSLQHDLLTLP